MEDHIARFEKACERLQEAPGLQLDSAQSENKKARTAHIEKPSSSASLDQTEDATAAIPLKPVNREREDELARKFKELEQTLEVKTRACNVLVEEVQQLSATIENQRKAIEENSELAASAMRQLVQCQQEMQQSKEAGKSAEMHTLALRETMNILSHSESTVRLTHPLTRNIPLVFYAGEHLQASKSEIKRA